MIYLDYQATTPLAPEAREAMIRHLDGPDGTGFGNPHSPHRLGRQAAAAIEAFGPWAKKKPRSQERGFFLP